MNRYDALGICEMLARTGMPVHPDTKARLLEVVAPLSDDENDYLDALVEARLARDAQNAADMQLLMESIFPRTKEKRP